jgi:hypothetical protein
MEAERTREEKRSGSRSDVKLSLCERYIYLYRSLYTNTIYRYRNSIPRYTDTDACLEKASTQAGGWAGIGEETK